MVNMRATPGQENTIVEQISLQAINYELSSLSFLPSVTAEIHGPERPTAHAVRILSKVQKLAQVPLAGCNTGTFRASPEFHSMVLPAIPRGAMSIRSTLAIGSLFSPYINQMPVHVCLAAAMRHFNAKALFNYIILTTVSVI